MLVSQGGSPEGLDMPTILVVEDEAIVALDLKMQLQEYGHTVTGVAASGAEALELAARTPPDLVLMDVRLQGAMDGIAAATLLRERQQLPVVFLTSHSDDDTVRRAARVGAYGYLTKPFQPRELRAGIEVALTKARMERQLRDADRWFAQTLQCVTDGVLVTEADSRLRFMNPAAERLTGWTSELAAGRPVDEVVRFLGRPGEPVPDAAADVQQVLLEGRPTAVRHGALLLDADGRSQAVDVGTGPVDRDDGRRLGAVVVLRDAAERMAQEVQLRASEARFRASFDHAPLGMALVSRAGELIQVNEAFSRLLGAPAAVLRGLDQALLSPLEDRAHEAERLHALEVAASGVVQFEKTYQRPADGRRVPVLVSVSLLSAGDDPACRLYQVHDLTQQKQAAEHVAALADERLKREASELASAAKNEFLARVSHEMRTPLNAVLGFAQLLQLGATADPGKTRAYADQIRAAGEHLLGLVSDLLDLNMAGDGRLRLDPQPLLLAQPVADVVALVGHQASAQEVSLVVQVPASLRVVADEQRLRQVLLNLVSNAVKYNRPGGSVRIEAAPDGHGGVLIVVQDNGVGMTQAQMDRLFQPFDRLGAEQSRIPGTGLGLVISRGLAQAMGGGLVLESRPKVGTRALLTMPAAA
jgi:PAS domain S-box-containing protein